MGFDCLALDDVVGFDWDDDNLYKNEKKHGIGWKEIEEVFFNEPLLVREDFKHSISESRCFALGRSDKGKFLFIVFTKRLNKIRPISARIMNKKERKEYENFEKDTSI